MHLKIMDLIVALIMESKDLTGIYPLLCWAGTYKTWGEYYRTGKIKSVKPANSALTGSRLEIRWIDASKINENPKKCLFSHYSFLLGSSSVTKNSAFMHIFVDFDVIIGFPVRH